MNSIFQNIMYCVGLAIFIAALSFFTIAFLTVLVKQINKK